MARFGGNTALGFPKGGGGGKQTSLTNLWGGIGNAFTGNASAKQAAKKQFQRELYMSNTAYQRAVADMKAAGLNPMLAYTQGGASTPAVGAAQVRPLGGELVKAYTGLMGSRQQQQMTDATTANLHANTAKAAADAANTQVDTQQREVQLELDKKRNPEIAAQAAKTTQKLQGDLDVLKQQVRQVTATATSAEQVATNQALLFPLQRQALELGNRAANLKMTQAELDQKIAQFKLDMLKGAGSNYSDGGQLLHKIGQAIQNGFDAAKEKLPKAAKWAKGVFDSTRKGNSQGIQK
ncbi:MAG: DNA pilot protein [Microviridae sp.]|nr:MAG: DNA pilot protein [Microviridae sp.]